MPIGGAFRDSEVSACCEKLERWNQHLYDRGGMRRVHLRGRENILKRLVVHSGAANLGFADAQAVRQRHAAGYSGPGAGCFFKFPRLLLARGAIGNALQHIRRSDGLRGDRSMLFCRSMKTPGFTSGC